MKKIIAYSKQRDAEKHPTLDWFQLYGESLQRDDRPCILRFTDGDCVFNRMDPYYDCDNDIMLSWFRNESDLENEFYLDYGYITTQESVTFLFDDGTTKTFVTPDHRDIRQHFDDDTEQPTGVFEELVNFLKDYIKNSGYEDEKLYVLTDDVFEDI